MLYCFDLTASAAGKLCNEAEFIVILDSFLVTLKIELLCRTGKHTCKQQLLKRRNSYYIVMCYVSTVDLDVPWGGLTDEVCSYSVVLLDVD